MGKNADVIRIRNLFEFAAALAQLGEDGYVATVNVLKIDFGHAAGIVADDNGGAGDVLEAAVFDPKLIGVVGIDRDRAGNVAELIVDQGEAGFVLADGGFPLAVKGGIDQRELPGWGRLACHDAELAAVEVEILGLVGDFMQAGESRADVEIDVAEKGVLCGVEANSDRAGVAGADLEVHVADGGVEGAGVGVGNRTAGRRYHAARRGRRMVQGSSSRGLRPGPGSGEKEHVGYTVLVSRRVFAQHEDGPFCSVPNDAHARPEIDGTADAVASLRNEDDAFPFAGLQLVDRRLDRCAIVCLAIRVDMELLGREVDGSRVVQPHWIGGSREAGRGAEKRREQQQ